MLVVLSDLHFEEEASFHIQGDGSYPALTYTHNLPATPYRLLLQRLAEEARRNNAKRLDFVLAGDIFDIHRSGLWFADNPGGVRPYVSNEEINAELEEQVLRILQEIGNEERVKEVLPLLRLLASGQYLGPDGQQLAFPVPVEVHFIPGNHDRLANASPAIRTAVRQALGLPAHGALFPNTLSFDEERALVRHGHEYDYANFSADMRRQESYPIHLPASYYSEPAFGDLATVDIAAQIPFIFRQVHGDAHILGDQTLRTLYLRLVEFDDLRPTTAIFNYFMYAEGQAVDQAVAWEAIEPVVIELLEQLHDHPFVLYWLDRFNQPWRLDMIDALKAVLAAKPWRWTNKHIPLELAQTISSLALKSTARRPAVEEYVARESSIRSGQHRYVIAGHTHSPRVSLIANSSQGERYYTDTGTWRNRVLATFDYRQFGRLKTVNYMTAYGPDEDRGVLPPDRNKLASFDYWSGLTQGWERDRQGIKAIDKQR